MPKHLHVMLKINFTQLWTQRLSALYNMPHKQEVPNTPKRGLKKGKSVISITVECPWE